MKIDFADSILVYLKRLLENTHGSRVEICWRQNTVETFSRLESLSHTKAFDRKPETTITITVTED